MAFEVKLRLVCSKCGNVRGSTGIRSKKLGLSGLSHPACSECKHPGFSVIDEERVGGDIHEQAD